MTGPSRKPGSFRRTGLYNVLISGFVAVTWYASLTLVARRFGGSPGSDAYFFLLSLSTLASTVLSSLFATVFLPVFVDLRVNQGLQAAARFAGSIAAWCLALILPLALASHVEYDPFYRLASKFSATQRAELRHVLIYFAPIFVASVASEYFRVIALALGRYLAAALAATAQPVTLIVTVLFFTGSHGEEAMAAALLTARLLSFAAMFAVVTFAARVVVIPSFARNPHSTRFLALSAPYWGANLVTNFSVFFFDYVATGLGTGVLSALSYAQRIFTLPGALVLNPLLEIGRTRFAEAQARGDRAALESLYNRLLQLALYFAIPVTALYIVGARPIISSMFERGAFTAANVDIAASCLRLYAFSLPFSCLFLVNGRACESFQRLLWPSVFGTVGNLALAGATFLLVGWLGYIGIPLARVAIDVLYFFPFGFVAFRLFAGTLPLQHIGRVVVTALAASLLPLLVAWSTGLDARLAPRWPSLPLLAATVMVFGAAYGALIVLLDSRLLALLRQRHRPLPKTEPAA